MFPNSKVTILEENKENAKKSSNLRKLIKAKSSSKQNKVEFVLVEKKIMSQNIDNNESDVYWLLKLK